MPEVSEDKQQASQIRGLTADRMKRERESSYGVVLFCFSISAATITGSSSRIMQTCEKGLCTDMS